MNKFEVGKIVQDKKRPEINLVIRRYYKRIYYCTVQADPAQKEKVYFENELIAQS
ncbi:MAG: hypothetical protein RIF39_12310 [Cyclobacteriaceae bacterium]